MELKLTIEDIKVALGDHDLVIRQLETEIEMLKKENETLKNALDKALKTKDAKVREPYLVPERGDNT